MNYQNWSKKRFWLTLAGVFFLGLLLSPNSSQPKEIVREVTVEKEVAQECNYSDWKELKTVDDVGFEYCRQAMELASNGFTAVANMDLLEMERVTQQIYNNNEKILDLATERQLILSRLGY